VVDYQALARENVVQFGRNVDALVEFRRRGVLTDEVSFDVRFGDFVADQVSTVAAIAERFGLPFDDDGRRAIMAHLAAKQHGGPGAHKHDFADLGLDAAAERARFADYQKYFGIPSEI
jgi:hypothetical protein